MNLRKLSSCRMDGCYSFMENFQLTWPTLTRKTPQFRCQVSFAFNGEVIFFRKTMARWPLKNSTKLAPNLRRWTSASKLQKLFHAKRRLQRRSCTFSKMSQVLGFSFYTTLGLSFFGAPPGKKTWRFFPSRFFFHAPPEVCQAWRTATGISMAQTSESSDEASPGNGNAGEQLRKCVIFLVAKIGITRTVA